MYTWGYLKNIMLDKMDLPETEASVQKLLNKFISYSNECLTYICSTVRPKQETYICKVVTQEDWDKEWNARILNKQADWLNEHIQLTNTDKDAFDTWWEENKEIVESEVKDKMKNTFVLNKLFRMPSNFIAFNGKSEYSKKTIKLTTMGMQEEWLPRQDAPDFIIKRLGENKVLCTATGLFYIAYDGRWMMFTEEIKDSDVLDVPFDILDAIPSFVASQCWKADDLDRAQLYRDEFELAYSRINNSDMRDNTTIHDPNNW